MQEWDDYDDDSIIIEAKKVGAAFLKNHMLVQKAANEQQQKAAQRMIDANTAKNPVSVYAEGDQVYVKVGLSQCISNIIFCELFHQT